MGIEENPRFGRQVQRDLGEDPNREDDPRIDDFIAKSRKRWEPERPKLEQFMPPREAQAMTAELEEMKKEFGDKTPESIAAEFMVMEGIYEYGWTGGGKTEGREEPADVYVIPASESDDIKNGIDLVVAIREGDGEWMYLGIDVTTTQDMVELREKLERTIHPLQDKKSPHVDFYYSSDSPDKTIGRIDLPRVVIGIDKERIGELSNDFLHNPGSLAEHPIQLEINQEIIDQLTTAIEIIVNNISRQRKNFVEYDFDSPKEALDLVRGQRHRQEFEQIQPGVLKIIDKHAKILEYMVAVQKEKGSVSEIPTQRATESFTFRQLAPKTTKELLRKAG